MHQSRQTRKEYAKMLGYTKKKQKLNKTSKEYWEIISNAIKAGKKIHAAFEESTLNSIKKQEAELEDRIIKNLMEPITKKDGTIIRKGLAIGQATQFVDDNRYIENQRKLKLATRREKQKNS